MAICVKFFAGVVCHVDRVTMSTVSGSNLMPTWQAGWSKLHLENLSDPWKPCPAHMVKLVPSSWQVQKKSIKKPHPQVQKLAVEEKKKNFVDKGKSRQDT